MEKLEKKLPFRAPTGLSLGEPAPQKIVHEVFALKQAIQADSAFLGTTMNREDPFSPHNSILIH